jgi:hypothetical protein
MSGTIDVMGTNPVGTSTAVVIWPAEVFSEISKRSLTWEIIDATNSESDPFLYSLAHRQ